MTKMINRTTEYVVAERSMARATNIPFGYVSINDG